MMRTIARLTLIALVLLLLAGVLIAAHDVSAGGGGQCGFAFVRLNCTPRVVCENPLARPELQQRDDGWHIYCRYDPQAPEG